MRISYRWIVVIAVTTVLMLPTLAVAQRQHPAALGDLMTALVQPRHIKLGLAGNERNWIYAAYELNQLRETLADIAEILPKYRDLSIPDMVESTVKAPLAALSAATQAKDGNRFNAAYEQLTAACNTCHRGYDRAEIVIQSPTGSSFLDQDFRPATK